MDLESLPMCVDCRWYFEPKDRCSIFRRCCTTCGLRRLEALALDLVNARTAEARRRARKAIYRLSER